jgi:hypothetical protein
MELNLRLLASFRVDLTILFEPFRAILSSLIKLVSVSTLGEVDSYFFWILGKDCDTIYFFKCFEKL